MTLKGIMDINDILARAKGEVIVDPNDGSVSMLVPIQVTRVRIDKQGNWRINIKDPKIGKLNDPAIVYENKERGFYVIAIAGISLDAETVKPRDLE